jgi:hypothetical protein
MKLIPTKTALASAVRLPNFNSSKGKREMGKKRVFTTRTLKDVPLTFEDESGERVTENFTVVYRSYSTKAVEQFEQELPETQRKDGTIPFSVMLAKQVISITDKDGQPLTGDDGEAVNLANGFFEGMPLEEVKALHERIQADIFPQTASQPPGPSTSTAAASEA